MWGECFSLPWLTCSVASRVHKPAVMKIHKVLDSDADEEKEDNVLIDRVSKWTLNHGNPLSYTHIC